jgi:hypothetical protein
LRSLGLRVAADQRLHAADRAATQAGAAVVEDGHRHLEALALAAEHVQSAGTRTSLN